MKTRWKWLLSSLALIALIGYFIRIDPDSAESPTVVPPAVIQTPVTPMTPPTPSETLLAGYADPETEPIEDVRKLHHVIGGYFSVIKDPARFPIGGNADLAAALKGENPNREVFLRTDHPVFSAEGLLVDRWGTPLVVHPEGWRQIELRSAGPDRKPYTADDLVILPNGNRKAE